MGILLEADYKGVVTGKESIWSGLSRAFSGEKKGASGNPLEQHEGTAAEPEEKDGQLTYELMNRDSGALHIHKSYLANRLTPHSHPTSTRIRRQIHPILHLHVRPVAQLHHAHCGRNTCGRRDKQWHFWWALVPAHGRRRQEAVEG